jgi:hypothetical protein
MKRGPYLTCLAIRGEDYNVTQLMPGMICAKMDGDSTLALRIAKRAVPFWVRDIDLQDGGETSSRYGVKCELFVPGYAAYCAPDAAEACFCYQCFSDGPDVLKEGTLSMPIAYTKAV